METETKVCFKCGLCKPIDEFYKHPQMRDGHLNKCKECTRLDAAEHLLNHPDVVHATDKRRSQKLERQKKVKTYLRKYRVNNPIKTKVHGQTTYAISVGKLIPNPCEVCGDLKVDAHHDDYDKPMEVRWLCRQHHKDLHRKYEDDILLHQLLHSSI